MSKRDRHRERGGGGGERVVRTHLNLAVVHCGSLLPGLDMCNHVGGDGANASWLPADGGAVELRRVVRSEAQRREEAGAEEVELTISYGDKTGALLCCCGFCIASCSRLNMIHGRGLMAAARGCPP